MNDRYLINFFFIVHDQLCEISERVLLQAFWLVRNNTNKGYATCDIR